MTIIAYQLYGSRNFQPFDDTLKMLAESGYKAVEGYSALYQDAGELRAQLDAHGLTMPSGHFAIDRVENDPEGVIEMARTLGIQKVIIPYLMPEDRPANTREDWATFAQRLARIGQPIRAAGLKFGWHNHEFELVDLGGGVTPLDLIAEAGVDLELDLGWAYVAGADPAELLRKYGKQILCVHVKDRAPAGTSDEDGWADVGHGVIDWAPIRAAMAEIGVDHWIVEHDNPSDHTRLATRSMAEVGGW